MDPISSFEELNELKGVKLVHLNVRSLVKKIDQIRLMLADTQIDMFTFSETWLKLYVHSNNINIKGFKTFRLDRETRNKKGSKKRGGGLITYVNEKHASSCENLTELDKSDGNIEAQWVYFHRPHCKDVVVCNMYRPPAGNLKQAIDYLEDCLKTINISKTDIFLVGDMNVNYKNKKSPNFARFNFFAQSNGLTQHIKNTTRNTDKSKSLIDLALTNSKFINQSGTLEHFISDHQPIFIVHKKARDVRKTVKFKGRSYRNYDKELFKSELAKLDWDAFYQSTNPEQAWSFIRDGITSILDQMCPIRSFSIKNYRPDWMTKDLIELIKDRDYFYCKAKRLGDEDYWRIAKYLRNVANLRVRQAKRDFILEELKQNENNPKKFWKTIREVIPDKCLEKQDILLKDGNEEVEKGRVAQYINEFFINVGKVNGPQTPPVSSTYLSDDSMVGSLHKVTHKEVWNVVKTINTAKSSGLDNISSFIMKEAFSDLIPEVAFMFNLSISSSNFPDTWKKALVIPIPKQGNLTKVQDYRLSY